MIRSMSNWRMPVLALALSGLAQAGADRLRARADKQANASFARGMSNLPGEQPPWSRRL